MPRLDDSFLYDDEPEESTEDRLDDTFLYADDQETDTTPEPSTFDTVVDTVSDTVTAIPKYAKGFFEGGAAAIENRRGIANKITASLESAQVGVASALGQIGTATNEFFGYEGKDALTDALNNYVKDNSSKVSKRLDTAIKGLQEEESKQKLTPEGEFFREAGTSALETSGSMLAGGSMKSVMVGIAAMGPQVFGQQYDQLKKDGESEQGAVLHGAAKTAIELGSEILPLKKLFNMPDGIVRKIADMTLVEGGTEAASSIADDLYDASLRDKNFDWDKSFDKLTESFKLGAAAGGMIGAAAATPQAADILATTAVDTAKAAANTGKQYFNSLGQKAVPVPDALAPDQAGQPGELFNPTHKAGGGTDVQVATKNGKIIPDTYIDESGNTIRDANAVANNPDESVNVTNDVSAVAASIKAEIAGKQAGKESGITLPEIKADEVISSLEQQNQQVINSAFAAPAPEVANQQIMNKTTFGKTQDQLRQDQINSEFNNEAVKFSKEPLKPEINPDVTQSVKEVEPNKEKAQLDEAAKFFDDAVNQTDIKADLASKEETAKEKESLTKSIEEVGAAKTKLLKENDTLGKFLAKIGGLNREEMEAQGLDPENFKAKSKVFGKPLFPKKGGLTADSLAEVLNEKNFRGGNLTANEAMELVFEVVDTDKSFIDETVEAEALDLSNQGDKMQQRLDEINQPVAKTGNIEAGQNTKNDPFIETINRIDGKAEAAQLEWIDKNPTNATPPDKYTFLSTKERTEFHNAKQGLQSSGAEQAQAKVRIKKKMEARKAVKKPKADTGATTGISPLELKKLAIENGADKPVYNGTDVNQSVPRETKAKKEVEKKPLTPSKKVEKNETQTANEAKTTEKEKNETKGVSERIPESSVLDPHKPMRGKEISYEVEVEETGETYTVTVDAGVVMDDINTRITALKELKDCI